MTRLTPLLIVAGSETSYLLAEAIIQKLGDLFFFHLLFLLLMILTANVRVAGVRTHQAGGMEGIEHWHWVWRAYRLVEFGSLCKSSLTSTVKSLD